MQQVQVETVDFGPSRDNCYDPSTFTVVVTTPRGEVFYHVREDLTERQAKLLAEGVKAQGWIDVDNTYWTFVRVIYGSDAFIEEEREASLWAQSIRAGHATEEDAPSNIRTLL